METKLNPNAPAQPDPQITEEIARTSPREIAPFGTVQLLNDTPIARSELQIVYGVGGAGQAGLRNFSLCLASGSTNDKVYTELVPVSIPIVIVAIGAREVWREWLPYQQGVIPREFASEADAHAGIATDGTQGNPCTTKWTGPMGAGTPPQAAPCLYLDMLVRKPENVESTSFCLQLGTDWYAPAWTRIDKQLYASVSNQIRLALIQDANRRKVHPTQASLSHVFMTLCTNTYKDRKGQARCSLALGQLTEKGKVVYVPDNFLEELNRLIFNAPDTTGDD